ncbi:hypothetical protein GCM10010259_19860 [Streptomyces daghestanicus]|uniref:Uncharacterized protein n=1 Tax=Streptomyces daghestanicus TaxID=66885 RepID=A0ABQ3QC62_9ACTN|nr:hypothetical protein GCM10010259_19860 [Streptomyces daghestanicus]GHI34876.1 hypothetical protein Sdagh_66060 [Streptomyces daghestanicus]
MAARIIDELERGMTDAGPVIDRAGRRRAAAGSWVTITTVRCGSVTACRSRPRTSSAVSGSRAPAGSSAKSTSGRVMRARAIATRCCCPPESSDGRRPSSPVSPTEAVTPWTDAWSGAAPASRSGRVMFRSTVSEGSTLNAWNTKPIRVRRNRVSCFSLSRPRSSPPSWTVPLVGRSSPAAQCRNVLLPEPE